MFLDENGPGFLRIEDIQLWQRKIDAHADEPDVPFHSRRRFESPDWLKPFE